VRFKPQPWQLILLIAAICCLSVGGMVWYHSGTLTLPALLKRIPSGDALVIWIDFAGLRRAGLLQLLAGARASEDPEYQRFVRSTRFDYMHDLDGALAAFPRDGSAFFLVQGRFDWMSLRTYVGEQSGQCVNSLCRVAGSGPDRRISFMPLRRDLMAMAVSPDAYAVEGLASARSGPNPPAPEGLVWLTFPGSLPKSAWNLPDGVSPFARIVENAPRVTLSFVPEDDRLAARLEVRCRTEQEAADLATQLTSTTQLLRGMIEREHQKPNPADFSGVLTSGVFRSEGARLLGNWPIERAFVQNLLGTQ
jgi:hypothetical protein